MPPDFHWESEEESWIGSDAPPPPPRFRRRWNRWLLLVLVAALLAGLGWRQFNRLAASVTQSEEEALTALTLIVRDAVQRGDGELLATLLAPGPAGWQQYVLDLAETGDLFSGAQLGWSPLGTATTPTVAVDADGQAATVTWQQSYQVRPGDAESEAVQLRHTAYFVREADGWRLAPLPEDEWGARYEFGIVDGRLAGAYPERDRELIQRLTPELELYLDQLCRPERGMTCDDDFQIIIVFLDKPWFAPISYGQLVLPAPTWLGLPVDDDAYAAFRTALAARTVQAALQTVSGNRCCEPFRVALTDAVLSQFALAPWPVQPALTAMVSTPHPLASLEEAWAWTGPARWPGQAQVYTFVDFLLQTEPEPNPARWLAALDGAPTLADWAAAVRAGDGALAAVVTDWQQYMYEQAYSIEIAPPLPAADLLLFCQDAGRAALPRLDLNSGDWTTELAFDGTADHQLILRPLVGRDGFSLEMTALANPNDDWRTLVWADGRLVGDFSPATNPFPVAYARRADPAGARQLFFQRDPNLGQTSLTLLDLNSCAGGACSLAPADGLPIWSPAGSRTLVLAGSRIYHGTAAGERLDLIGRGVLPFWLDEDTYGFLRVASVSSDANVLSSEFGTFVVAAGDDEEQRLLAASDLLAAVPPSHGVDALFLHAVQPHPSRPGRLLALASALNRAQYYVFTVDLSPLSGEITAIRYQFHVPEPPVQFYVDPRGEWLAMPAGSPDDAWATLYVHHFGEASDPTVLDRTRAHPVVFDPVVFNPGDVPAPAPGDHAWFGWDPGGSWLFLLSGNRLLLLHPATGYRQVVAHEFAGCRDGLWTSRPVAAPLPDFDLAGTFNRPGLTTYIVRED